ncbi:MAG: Gfo/Idh/MocA family oxidoreductase [Chthoniobacterales bacterium]
MTTIRWGLVGPGAIARKFARDLRVAGNARLVAVAGRDLTRAQAFAAEFEADLAYDDYRALADDPNIDIVYIASPHQAHFAPALAMLEAGKAVLCEKPMTVNAAETRLLIATARARGVFLMEAVWTRFLPIYARVREWLEAGRIGPVRFASSTFCVKAGSDPEGRMYNPHLAGGALLDLGIYNLTMLQWLMREAPESFVAQAQMAETGVDEMTSVALRYPGNRAGQFTCGMTAHFDNAFIIGGEEGCIRLPSNFICAEEATLTVGDVVETAREPFRGEGFEYEIEEAMRCLRAGEMESPLLPHADTLATMTLMDAIRREIGLMYPFEKAAS